MSTFNDLVNLMERLRSPNGCPWDREQTYATLAPMLLEEAYEAFEAVELARDGQANDLRDELGDLLFQIVFYAQVAKERGEFTIADVTSSVHDKMVRRHPHVFGDARADSTAEVLKSWEAIKAAEKQATHTSGDDTKTSLLDGVSTKVPALMEAHQLSTKAARVGFDWEKLEDIFDKLNEEVAELRAAIQTHSDSDNEENHTRVREEIGDLLFAVTNIARHLKVEPEAALKLTNRKFRSRSVTLKIVWVRSNAASNQQPSRSLNRSGRKLKKSKQEQEQGRARSRGRSSFVYFKVQSFKLKVQIVQITNFRFQNQDPKLKRPAYRGPSVLG